jgi:hypothetical protein
LKFWARLDLPLLSSQYTHFICRTNKTKMRMWGCKKVSHQSLCWDSYLIFKWAIWKFSDSHFFPYDSSVCGCKIFTIFLKDISNISSRKSNMLHKKADLPIAAIHCDFGAFRQQHSVDGCWLSLFLSIFAGGKHNGGLDWFDVLPTNDGIGSEDFVFIFSKCSFEFNLELFIPTSYRSWLLLFLLIMIIIN